MSIARADLPVVTAGLVMKETGAPVPLVGVKAAVDIVGRGAKVRISQSFRNGEETPIEAVYRFPMPEGAAVCGFRAVVGDRVINGEIEDREKAFEKYDDAMAEGHGAYLFDEERPNIFTVSVGNLRPGDVATMEIDYVELLQANGGESRFFLPTTISPRYTPAGQPDEEDIPVEEKVAPSGGYRADVPYGLDIRVEVHGKDAIASVESPSHRIRQEFLEDRIAVTLTGGTAKMDRDFVLTIARREDFRSCAYAFTGGKGSFLQVDLSIKESCASDARQVKTFVIDCSGSMMGSSIEQANAAMTAVLRGMKEGDLFNIYRFGTAFEKFFPQPVPYSGDTLQKSLDRIGRVVGLGGTEILSVIRDACDQEVPDGYSLAVFLLTDGQVSNEKEVVDFVGERSGRIRVFPLGVGHGVNEYFIREIARASAGASELVAPGERIEPRALRLFGKLDRTSVADVRLAHGIRGAQAPSLPSVFPGETVSIFTKLEKGKIPASIALKGNMTGTAGAAWSETLPVLPVPENGLSIPALWAREIIREIEGGRFSSGGSRQERKKSSGGGKKAAEISREFGVLCATTSFVAVETRQEERKAKGEAALRKVPAMLTRDWGGISREYMLPAPPSIPRSDAFHRKRLLDIGHSFNYELCMDVPDQDMRFRLLHPGWVGRVDLENVRGNQAAGSRKESRTDRLMTILSGQSAEGGFRLDEKIAKAIGVPLSTLKRAAKSFQGSPGSDASAILGTAVVLVALETRFADMSDLWSGLVEKSREWLKEQGASRDLKVGRKGLMEWARECVSGKEWPMPDRIRTS